MLIAQHWETPSKQKRIWISYRKNWIALRTDVIEMR